MMLAFNPHGGYNKPNVRDYSWDQESLISELKKASAAGTGIVAMKTCFGGPYCYEGNDNPARPRRDKVLQLPVN